MLIGYSIKCWVYKNCSECYLQVCCCFVASALSALVRTHHSHHLPVLRSVSGTKRDTETYSLWGTDWQQRANHPQWLIIKRQFTKLTFLQMCETFISAPDPVPKLHPILNYTHVFIGLTWKNNKLLYKNTSSWDALILIKKWWQVAIIMYNESSTMQYAIVC